LHYILSESTSGGTIFPSDDKKSRFGASDIWFLTPKNDENSGSFSCSFKSGWVMNFDKGSSYFFTVN